MKRIEAIELLGSPKSIDRQQACPECSARSVVFEDGSVICVIENKIFAPESTDRELWQLRLEFDRRHGITVADRLEIPARVKLGQAVSDSLTYRCRR